MKKKIISTLPVFLKKPNRIPKKKEKNENGKTYNPSQKKFPEIVLSLQKKQEKH